MRRKKKREMEEHLGRDLEKLENRNSETWKTRVENGGGFAQRGARKKVIKASEQTNFPLVGFGDPWILGRPTPKEVRRTGARPINPALMSTLTTIHPDHRPGLERQRKRKGREAQRRWKRNRHGEKEEDENSIGEAAVSNLVAPLYIQFGAVQTGMAEWLGGEGEGVSNAKEGLEEWRTQGRKRATNQTYSGKAATGTESGGTCKATMKAHSF